MEMKVYERGRGPPWNDIASTAFGCHDSKCHLLGRTLKPLNGRRQYENQKQTIDCAVYTG